MPLKSDMALTLESQSFENDQVIPKKFGYKHGNVSPPLKITDIPENTESLALIMDDPDAPMGMWVHWVVYNIPIALRLDEDSIPGEQAMNDFGRSDYGGPCPPSGTHRYFFKIYALDIELSLKEGARKEDLEKAIKGHILDKAELIGLYKKH